MLVSRFGYLKYKKAAYLSFNLSFEQLSIGTLVLYFKPELHIIDTDNIVIIRQRGNKVITHIHMYNKKFTFDYTDSGEFYLKDNV